MMADGLHCTGSDPQHTSMYKDVVKDVFFAFPMKCNHICNVHFFSWRNINCIVLDVVRDVCTYKWNKASRRDK
jgi:hypothetical protein